MCACVCACVRVCVHECVSACMSACVHACMRVSICGVKLFDIAPIVIIPEFIVLRHGKCDGIEVIELWARGLKRKTCHFCIDYS